MGSSNLGWSPSTVVGEAFLCKRSFQLFVKTFWPLVPGAQEVKWNWHMSYLCAELQALAEDVFAGRPRHYDLICNISPGTSKSTIASILFPAWCWARMPNVRVLTASHTDDLVLDLSNKSRQVIKSDLYKSLFPEIEFRSDQDTKGYFANTRGGDRYTCTVSGKSPMGFHAHIIIIDDPIDPKKAASEVELKVAQDFFDNVIPSRKVDKEVSVTFLIMQRLHPEDPTGHWLKKSRREGAAKLKWIKLPAELPKTEEGYDTSLVEPKDEVWDKRPLGEHYVEGLMDPLRLTRKALKERMSDGIYAYAGQYLQDPIALGGGMFRPEYFNLRCKAAPYQCVRVRYYDRASSENAGARTAGVLLAMDKEKKLYVEHVIAGQWEPSKRNAVIKSIAYRDRARYGPRYEPIICVEREGGSSGKDAFQAILRMLTGFTVKEHNIMGMGKKEVRADPWSAQLAAGNVWMVDNGESEGAGKSEWDVQSYIDEHLAFPVGTFLDQVDASSGALAMVVKTPDYIPVYIRGTTEKKKEETNIYVCTPDDAEQALQHGPVLLIDLTDPEPVGKKLVLQYGDIIDSILLQFLDIHPEEAQSTWLEPIEPYGKPVEELVFQRSQAKQLWAFLLKRRDRKTNTIVIIGDGSRKAMSLAIALTEVLHLSRKAIFSGGSGNNVGTEDKIPNQYIGDIVRAGRYMVVE